MSVFATLSRLFIVAVWPSEEKGLTSRLLLITITVILLLYHLVTLGQVSYLIVSIPDPFYLSIVCMYWYISRTK